jgi:hypothetical protein
MGLYFKKLKAGAVGRGGGHSPSRPEALGLIHNVSHTHTHSINLAWPVGLLGDWKRSQGEGWEADYVHFRQLALLV